ncbi:MAG TPA: heparinase II/III family protein, partial [Opitutaceae bacterium]|nr:heparinase II/III family protein [Opitutaceae bacterium]
MRICSMLRLFVAGMLLLPSAALMAQMAKKNLAEKITPYPLPKSWPSHPRLIATAEDWDKLAARRASDHDLDTYANGLVVQARKVLSQNPIERKLTGRRLLWVSRELIRRNLLLAFAYRVTGERAFFDKARSEMLNVAAFSDWHPDHFLDVAEMTAGMALGYDWLYNELSAEDRKTIRQAIVEKGCEYGRFGHRTFLLENNWGQVCIGGLVLGALAIGDEEPELASTLLAAAKADSHIALGAYKPDGVYPEGPGYWIYGTTFETLLISALRTALGTDWDLLKSEGLERSALFYAHAVGPTGKYFDYSDSGEKASLAPPILFFARELHQPTLAAAQYPYIKDANTPRLLENDRFTPVTVFWWPFDPAAKKADPLPLYFAGQGPNPLAMWRSSWTDPNALYFAIKGGGAALSHAHMDGGSFVFDLDGVRWASDLGMQEYESLESKKIDLWNKAQNSDRWKVFRLNNYSHNTLTIDNAPHNVQGLATLRHATPTDAELDLTQIFFPGQVDSVTRKATVGADSVTISDDVRGAKSGAEIRWAMTTFATIKIAGTTATLTAYGKTVVARVTGANCTLEVKDISKPPADYDATNPGASQLIVK